MFQNFILSLALQISKTKIHTQIECSPAYAIQCGCNRQTLLAQPVQKFDPNSRLKDVDFKTKLSTMIYAKKAQVVAKLKSRLELGINFSLNTKLNSLLKNKNLLLNVDFE